MKRKIVLTYLSPLVSVLGNLLLAYVVYFIARMTFLAENWNLYSDNLSWSHLMEMLRGGLMFDTTAILYTNALWVVMVLFPLHLKETKTYHEVCRWVFVVIGHQYADADCKSRGYGVFPLFHAPYHDDHLPGV